jgi:hypothetical protein
VLASLVGTTIEFYDFYIFGTAAALVFGNMFRAFRRRVSPVEEDSTQRVVD